MSERANLSSLLIEAWRRLRETYDETRTYRELLLVSLAALAELTTERDAARRANRELRAQLRAVISGRTIAEERQTIEKETVAVQEAA